MIEPIGDRCSREGVYMKRSAAKRDGIEWTGTRADERHTGKKEVWTMTQSSELGLFSPPHMDKPCLLTKLGSLKKGLTVGRGN